MLACTALVLPAAARADSLYRADLTGNQVQFGSLGDPSAKSAVVTSVSYPPNTWIDSGPSGVTRDRTPSFAFHSVEAIKAGPTGYTFQCAVDRGAFAACTSPHRLARLRDGRHVFRVRATDAAGVTDSTPATRRFTVDTKVLVRIRGKRLGRRAGRRVVVRVRCPVHELSGPCAGRLRIVTRARVRFRGRRRHVLLAHGRLSVRHGKTHKVKLRLSKRKARLLRRRPRSRAVRVVAHVRDRTGNRARVAKRSKIVRARHHRHRHARS